MIDRSYPPKISLTLFSFPSNQEGFYREAIRASLITGLFLLTTQKLHHIREANHNPKKTSPEETPRKSSHTTPPRSITSFGQIVTEQEKNSPEKTPISGNYRTNTSDSSTSLFNIDPLVEFREIYQLEENENKKTKDGNNFFTIDLETPKTINPMSESQKKQPAGTNSTKTSTVRKERSFLESPASTAKSDSKEHLLDHWETYKPEETISEMDYTNMHFGSPNTNNPMPQFQKNLSKDTNPTTTPTVDNNHLNTPPTRNPLLQYSRKKLTGRNTNQAPPLSPYKPVNLFNEFNTPNHSTNLNTHSDPSQETAVIEKKKDTAPSTNIHLKTTTFLTTAIFSVALNAKIGSLFKNNVTDNSGPLQYLPMAAFTFSALGIAWATSRNIYQSGSENKKV